MVNQPYQKYVFDVKNRKFIGEFEKMYQDEDKKNYDSWFQEDLRHLARQISLAILNKYNFNSILDIGCGKGAFTHLLKKVNNRVVGADISKSAIKKAKVKYKDIEFFKLSAEKSLLLKKRWDLVIMLEVFSYLKDWKEILAKIAKRASYIYVSLYIPQHPIGFVKSFDELKNEINKYFNIETEVLLNEMTIFVLGKNRNC